MRNPTRQELMEFVDATLSPNRQAEIEFLVQQSPSLQKEVALLKAMERIIQADLTISPSKSFASNVMKEIFLDESSLRPVQLESLVFRLLKNSSNVFAMILVLSLIAIVLVSPSSSSVNTTNPISQGLDSFSSLYNTMVKHLSDWTSQYAQPLNEATKTSSGKMMFLALIIFSLYIVLDGIIGKKYFHARMKN